MRSNQVFSVLDSVYSRKWYLENKEGLKKYKGSSSNIWGKNEYWNQVIERSRKKQNLRKIVEDKVEFEYKWI